MIASKDLILILALSHTRQIAADRAYSTLQLSDYPKKLRTKSSTAETAETRVVVDNRYSFDHGGRAAAAAVASSSSSVEGGRRDNSQHAQTSLKGTISSILTKSFFLAAVYCCFKFLSPRAVHYLSVLCGEISAFKNSLQTRSDELLHRRRRQKRRRSSCSSSGATTKFRNINDKRNNGGGKEKSTADTINGDGQSMSSSVMEILGLADFEDYDEDENDDTIVDEESFISNNSTISTVSSIFSFVRTRRRAAASSCVVIAPARTLSQKNANRQQNAPMTKPSSKAQNLRPAPKSALTSLPKVLHFINDGDIVHDKMIVQHNNNKGGRHCRTKTKEMDIHTNEWLDDASHIPTVPVDWNENNQWKKSNKRIVGPAYA
ncbi:hypothetical protein ACHAWU_010204 [Discostella pseudostelligera]|uniref:Uncharacterized protein n=1 Tax=Discostella pseudostelligera TaxID=259834 RepID=A0ABD3MES2_9STRA